MSAEQLWFWKYRLSSRTNLNAVAVTQEREGALIRDFGGGVGCIHPWPELGDAGLDEQLDRLAAGKPANLGVRALACAELDGLARRENRSLFASVRVPPSHWLASPGDDANAVSGEGFSTVKLKAGSNLDGLAERIVKWTAENFRIRLDFNESQQILPFLDYWKNGLSSDQKQAVEFVEDPIPWDPDAWETLRDAGVPLAADRNASDRLGQADWAIVKPALANPGELVQAALQRRCKVVFTSYLDHALGQLFAAFCAAEFAGIFPDQLHPAGLLTHECFEPDPFFEQLGRDGPILKPPSGTGLGFDDLLESLPWKKLT